MFYECAGVFLTPRLHYYKFCHFVIDFNYQYLYVNSMSENTENFICPRCNESADRKEFEKNNRVCGKCNYHSRITWQERLQMTADPGSFTEFDAGMNSKNPIGFPDYKAKIAGLQKNCNTKEAVVTGECTIMGYAVIIGIMDSNFMMASMGSVVGEKITRALEYGIQKKKPVVFFTASGGARMQEGIFSLMQMAKTSGAVAKLGKAGQLYIAVLSDPTTGGVTASFASLGDIILAEPGATIGFAGKRVIQDTIGEKLPGNFQTSEFLQEHGFADRIVSRDEMRPVIACLLALHNYKPVSSQEPR
jgi:acetyl-CoA carboxylase carboxyl transferase subunit beta